MSSLKYSENFIRQDCENKGLIFKDICTLTYNKKKRRSVCFVCEKHIDKGIQIKPVEKLVNAKKPCQYCNHTKLSDVFKEEIANISPNIEVMSECVNTDSVIKCKCKIDGYEWSAVARALLAGEGCKKCGYKKVWETRGRITTDDFKKKMKQINDNIEIIGEYTGSHNLIKCKCKLDGQIWESYACNLLNQSASCPFCNQSLGEKKMVEILERKGYNIIQQKSFDDCKYIKKLRFDAYDCENNIVYEYQGQQHYYPVDFAENGAEWAEEQYNISHKRDLIKSDYCKSNNIPLIEIPYWEYDNMEEFLNCEISKYI